MLACRNIEIVGVKVGAGTLGGLCGTEHGFAWSEFRNGIG